MTDERTQQFLEAPYVPRQDLDTESRVASALEYIAYQLYQIRQDSAGNGISLSNIERHLRLISHKP